MNYKPAWALFLMLLLLGWWGEICAQTPVPEEIEEDQEVVATLLYVDDVNLTPRLSLPLNRADLVRFDAYGLEPGSNLILEARRGGFRVHNETLTANPRGEAKTVMIFERATGRISCSARYITQNGRERRIKFYLEGPD